MPPKRSTPKRSRPDTTLFINMSIDGRIVSHDSDLFDPDKSWKQDPPIRAILQQSLEFDQPGMTVLTTGIAMQTLGINTRQGKPMPQDLSLVVLDPDADLNLQGITYLTQNVKKLFYVCLKNNDLLRGYQRRQSPVSSQVGKNPTQSQPQNTNPQLTIKQPTVLPYSKEIDLNHLFTTLYHKHNVSGLFIHSIAPLNADLLEAGLIDHLSVIIYPLLVGGHGTPLLQDSDIFTIRPLTLVSTRLFSDNYVNIRYQVELLSR